VFLEININSFPQIPNICKYLLNIPGTLMRTCSLPAVIEAAGNDEWKKRKEAQSLKRLEVKKKRIERRNSLTCNTSKEAAGQIPEEMNAHADKLVSSDEAVVMNNENHSSGKHLVKGLPPKYQATIASQDSLSAVGKKPNSAFKGIPFCLLSTLFRYSQYPFPMLPKT
jgi:hypothetical protein